MKQKRTCSRCKEPIAKTHRWHYVNRKLLWWTVTKIEHRDCKHPEMNPHNPYAVRRLKGEVPLPFPEQIEHDCLYDGLPGEHA